MLRTDKTIDPNNAAKKPVIIKPVTNLAMSKNISALIINVKSPRVSKLSGRVKTNIIGRINMLTSPIINAANKAVEKPAKLIPGTTQAVKSRAAANSNHLTSILIIFSLLYFCKSMQYKTEFLIFH